MPTLEPDSSSLLAAQQLTLPADVGAWTPLESSINPMVGKCLYIARAVYRMLKYKVEYEPLSVAEYEKHYQDQQLKYLEKKAAKFGLQLVPTWLFLRTRY